MVINMNESKLCTIEQIEQFLQNKSKKQKENKD